MQNFKQYFIGAIKNHYADFNGKATRREYWYFVIFSLILSIAFATIDVLIINPMLLGATPLQSAQGGLLQFAYALAVFLPSLSIGVRRLHDLKKSGWWLLLAFVPLVGPIILIYWFLQKGE